MLCVVIDRLLEALCLSAAWPDVGIKEAIFYKKVAEKVPTTVLCFHFSLISQKQLTTNQDTLAHHLGPVLPPCPDLNLAFHLFYFTEYKNGTKRGRNGIRFKRRVSSSGGKCTGPPRSRGGCSHHPETAEPCYDMSEWNQQKIAALWDRQWEAKVQKLIWIELIV